MATEIFYETDFGTDLFCSIDLLFIETNKFQLNFVFELNWFVVAIATIGIFHLSITKKNLDWIPRMVNGRGVLRTRMSS